MEHTFTMMLIMLMATGLALLPIILWDKWYNKRATTSRLLLLGSSSALVVLLTSVGLMVAYKMFRNT